MDSMEEHRKAVGKRVEGLREDRGWTQPVLAAMAGISQPTLWAIENGQTKEVTARSLIGIARALETTWEYLWDGAEDADGSEQEAELVSIFRRLQEPGRLAVLQSARSVLSVTPPRQTPTLGAVPKQKDIGDEFPETDLKKFPRKHPRKRQA